MGYNIDLHVHTTINSPCSEIDFFDLLHYQERNKDIQAITITDHSSKRPYPEFNCSKPVIIGREFTLQFTERSYDLVFFSMQGTESSVLKKKGKDTTVIWVHPMRHLPLVFNANYKQAENDLDKYLKLFPEVLELVKFVDTIEVFNAQDHDYWNFLSLLLAIRFEKHMTSGSDAHFIEQLNKAYTIFQFPIKTKMELIESIKKGYIKPSRFSTIATKEESLQHIIKN